MKAEYCKNMLRILLRIYKWIKHIYAYYEHRFIILLFNLLHTIKSYSRLEECSWVEYVQIKTSTSFSIRTATNKIRAHWPNELQMALKNTQFKLLKNSWAIKQLKSRQNPTAATQLSKKATQYQVEYALKISLPAKGNCDHKATQNNSNWRAQRV